MKIEKIQTAKGTLERWHIYPEEFLDESFDPTKPMIVLDPKITFQSHIGFGGAFTEAAAYTFAEMTLDQQNDVIKKYYSEEGLKYTLGRTAIHSSDFALENYTYVKENDKKLATFDLSREDQWVVPMIKKAMTYQSELKLLASPWSPPAWMKTNQDMNHGGSLLPKYRQTWANYFVKYLEHMNHRGIPFWAVTIQNEPQAVQTWDSCIYTAEEERDFLRDYLGPTLHTYDPNLKILGWDHNRDIIIPRAKTLLSDPEAQKHLWGIAHHWYVSEAFENLSVVKSLFPDKHLLFTEGCIEGGPKPHEWHTGERYGRNILGDLNNHVEGWIDWNLILNEEGGPNHVKNYCDSPILYDRQTKDLIINSSYYYIGHFSRYIQENAKRIKTTMNLPKGIYATAYQNPNQELVVIIQNETNDAPKISLVLVPNGKLIQLEPHSIVTLLIKN